MIIIVDALTNDMFLQKAAAPQIFLRGDLGFPLERRAVLGHKECCGNGDGNTSCPVGGVLPPDLPDLVGKLCNGDDILIGFRRQSQHKIELDFAPSACKGRGTGTENVFLRHIFIDCIPEPLCACLRRKSQTTFPHLLYLFHQFHGEIICAE